MKTHEVIIINECRLPRGGTRFTYSVLQTFLRISFVSKVFCTFAAYMRRLPHILLCLWALCMLIGCAGDGYTPALRTADSLMNDSPSVALAMLDSLKGEAQGWSKARRMRYHLLTMKAQNKAYVDFTSDSLAKDVVEYYDNHGTANDRLQAYYLLGCVYRDLGESPEALQAYYDAISVADTATADCDMSTLASVYGQMSQIFHQQDLPHDEVWAWQNYSKFIKETGGAKDYIIAKSQLIRPYYLLGEKDSVLKIISDSYQSLKLMGYTQDAAEMLPTAIYIYTERKDLLVARQMIDIYERESGLFDGNGNIARGREHYYVTKGFFKLAINEMDSAENCFRNAIQSGYLSDGYKGLLSVYRHKNVLDSIVHFSLLYEAAQDSLHDNMQMETIHRMSALFNYNRFQKQAADNARKVSMAVIFIASLVLAFAAISIFVIVKWRKKKESHRKELEEFNKLKKDYEVTSEQYQKNIHILELLDTSHQAVIATIQRELEHSQKESDTYQKNYAKAQQEMAQISAQYESDKQKLKEENQRLSLKLELLEQKSLISKKLQVAKSFAETDIVKLIMVKERKPLSTLSGKDWKQLVNAVETYYPDILHDLSFLPKGSLQKTRTCLLVLLKISDSRIADWLDVKPTRVSNIKSELNQALFGDSSARSLYDNLKRKYSLIQDV